MKIICVGQNYLKHIEELKSKKSSTPVIFLKPDSSLIAKNQPFFIPEFSNEIHYEIELILKFNRLGKHISKDFAYEYFDQISLGVDFTARDLQKKLKSNGHPWEKAKAFDHSAVIGNFTSKKNYTSLENINFELKSNGVTVQEGNTNLMLWKIDELISYVSQYFTLKIGDIIFTGTPKGVAKVTEGDVLEGFIEGKSMFKVQIR